MAKPQSGVGRSAPLAATERVPTPAVSRVGVDLVDVARFSRLVTLRGAALCRRVFTRRELETCHGSVTRLAARFAAKEATAKALGTGIGPIAWRDVEIRTTGRGETELILAGAARVAARKRGLDAWAVSLSHDATHAIALVVATGRHGTKMRGRGPRP
jgi:holo-[acyl-carrier protein] synthase